MKQSPLKDVAGMLRSFSYAGAAGFGTEPSAERSTWEKAATEAFLEGYREAGQQTAGHDAETAAQMLRAYLLDKALYEIVYEVNNRPGWISIPLSGILELLTGDKT